MPFGVSPGDRDVCIKAGAGTSGGRGGTDRFIHGVICREPYQGGGNSNMFNFHPDPWGFMIQFDEHMFQMGWFNHQPAIDGRK